LHSREKINWSTAVDWYMKLITNHDDENESNQNDLRNSVVYTLTDEPIYMVVARVAELHRNGGNGLEPDNNKAIYYYNEAAEIAMSMGKGRLSNKYYMDVETISAELE
jgi:elongation factor 2 kinase